MNRAYATLEIKRVDDDLRIIEGIASTPSVDRVGDIVDPKGATFKLPLPFLYQHDSRSPIGHVTKANVTKSGIAITAKIAKNVSDEIDRAWSLIKSGLVRGLSIGFRAIETEPIKGTFGVKFTEWEWLELSAVTIPANVDATIQAVKSLDVKQRAASGRSTASPTSPGVSGSHRKPVDKGTRNMKTIEQRLQALEEERAAKAARIDEIAPDDEGKFADDAAKTEYRGLGTEMDEIDEQIRDLEIQLRASKTAKPISAKTQKDAADSRGGNLRITQKSNLEPGIAFARAARVKALARLDGMDVVQLAERMYGNDQGVVTAVKGPADVAAGTTFDGTWAGPLVGAESSAFADFAEFLRPTTIVGKFGVSGVPSLRRVPFRVALVGQTSGGAGFWVGEAKAKPLTRLDFERRTLQPLKVANIAVLTQELVRDSSPSAETIIRDQLAEALRALLDVDFIRTTNSGSATSPASITNGIVAITSSGNDAADVREDVRAILASFAAANNPPSTGVWVMSQTTALALSIMVNMLGNPEFSGITMNGGVFFGLPVITSQHVTESIVVLVNAGDVYLGDEGGVNVDMSMEASLEMVGAGATGESSDGSSPPGVTATSLVSLWQTNSVGFRAERTINWMRRRESGVAVLDSVEWGVAGSPE